MDGMLSYRHSLGGGSDKDLFEGHSWRQAKRAMTLVMVVTLYLSFIVRKIANHV
jgi:hypothetical protein